MSTVTRKLQLTGGSTIIVSLPKKWVSSLGMRPGDEVTLVLNRDGTITVMPKTLHRTNEKPEAVIRVTRDMSPEVAVREFIGYYLVGYDVIRVEFGNDTEMHRSQIKEAIRDKLIGVEVMEESEVHLVARCLITYTEFSLNDALNRMRAVTSLMLRDAVKALISYNIDLAEDVCRRDNDVDRLYLFIVRQLKTLIRQPHTLSDLGLRTVRDCLGYRLVAKTVERIADHAMRIAEVSKSTRLPKDEDLFWRIEKARDLAIDLFNESLSAFIKLDKQLAHEVIERSKEMSFLEEEILENLLKHTELDAKDVANLRLAFESLRRSAEYSADIAEIAINMAILEPVL
ncbi:MAG: PhoU domain-containing protein [Candidatus Baldrarchaeia archaeon]